MAFGRSGTLGPSVTDRVGLGHEPVQDRAMTQRHCLAGTRATGRLRTKPPATTGNVQV